MDEGPRFPARVLSYWLGLFCATVALLTIWLLQIGVVAKIITSAIFLLVPFVIIGFWLGRAAEARARCKGRLSDHADHAAGFGQEHAEPQA
jgi:hypothetical protein